MSKRQVLLVLGIWIMIFLFINFPSRWDKIFSLCTGLIIVFIAFRLPSQQKPRGTVPYVENKTHVSQSNQVGKMNQESPVVKISQTEIAKPIVLKSVPIMNDIIKSDIQ